MFQRKLQPTVQNLAQVSQTQEVKTGLEPKFADSRTHGLHQCKRKSGPKWPGAGGAVWARAVARSSPGVFSAPSPLAQTKGWRQKRQVCGPGAGVSLGRYW